MENVSERLINMQPLWNVWRIVEFIGEGSYGKVYKIVREEYGNTYVSALKWIYLPQHSGDIRTLASEGMSDDDIRTYYEGLIQTLHKEIRLMSSLGGNTHIVNYADHSIIERTGEIGWDILIRMEYLTPLDTLVKERPFSEQDVVTLGIHICQALTLCAGHMVLHRDVKPENIFISPDGNYKLGDFGVSRTMEKTLDSLTAPRGTPMYMAPEVYNNLPTDFTADVYSLGLVMYRLLNRNRMPFLPLNDLPTHDDRTKAVSRRLRGEMLPSPAKGCKDLQRIVLKACAYKREERYASADEMCQQLERLARRGRLSSSDLLGETRDISRLCSNRTPITPPIRPESSSAPPVPAETTDSLYGINAKSGENGEPPKEVAPAARKGVSHPAKTAKKPKSRKIKRSRVVLGIVCAALVLILGAWFALFERVSGSWATIGQGEVQYYSSILTLSAFNTASLDFYRYADGDYVREERFSGMYTLRGDNLKAYFGPDVCDGIFSANKDEILLNFNGVQVQFRRMEMG